MASKYGAFKEYLSEEYVGPFMVTDILIRHNCNRKEGLVIIERKYPPLGLALPGGIAEDITFSDNSIKEAKEETGLDVVLDDQYKPFCVLSNPNQDPRAFIATAVYTGRGYGELKPDPKEDAKNAHLFSRSELEGLVSKDVWAFPHHKKIVSLLLKDENFWRRLYDGR